MRSLEHVLKDLVDRASPGDVRLNVPRSAWMREYSCYEVSIQTRSYDESFTGKTIGEAVRSAEESFKQPIVEGDHDPIVPSWYRVTRMQRVLVEQVLERHRAEHMANASAANIKHERMVAQAEYAMADAFKAAIDALFYEDNDERAHPLEKEPLAPRDDASPNDAILVRSCKLRATDPSRYYVPAEGPGKKDVFDVRNFMAGNVEVLRLADFSDHEEGKTSPAGDAPTGFGLAETTTPDPTRKILSAIDLTAWLEELTAEERRMLELRAAGYTLAETATRLGMSISGVLGGCRKLGFALGDRAGVEVRRRETEKIALTTMSSGMTNPVIPPIRRTRTTASCAA